MVRFFVSVVRRRRLQVVTVNSITTVENGRLGNLKKTQGNNFVFLKNEVYFWRCDREARQANLSLVQRLTLLFVLTNQVRAASGCLQVNKATIM